MCVCVRVRARVYSEKKKDCFGLAFLLNGIWTFVGYLIPKPFFKKYSSGTI